MQDFRDRNRPVAQTAQAPKTWDFMETTFAALVAYGVFVLVSELALVALALAVGIWIGPRVGLGAPLLLGLLDGDPDAWPAVRASILPAIAAGVAAGLAIVALDAFVFRPLLAVTRQAIV